MIAIVACGAISGLGEQDDASGIRGAGEGACVAITHDEELARGGLARPLASRVRLESSEEDRATMILKRALALLVSDLDVTRPNWRSERVGIALATSSGGMRSAEIFFRHVAAREVITRETAANATYFAPMVAALVDISVEFSPATLVLTACAASTIAIGIGTRWLEANECDLVIAGGFDAVSVFVASGFEVLRATTGTIPPRPFCKGRDGMSLGEAGALFALAREAPRARAFIAGFGASSDAVHLTAPDRTGDGLARASEAALKNAQIDPLEIDLVSAHATATPFNDAAEMKALGRVLGAARPTIVPLKAQVGHTLGAAGALETLACVDAIERRVFPASAARIEIEPDLPGIMRDVTTRGDVRAALKLSAAFGGANAALVVTRDPKKNDAPSPLTRDVFVSRGVVVEIPPDVKRLADRTGIAVDKLLRGDGLVRFALAAVAALEDACGPLRGAGIVVGHSLATLETNYMYYAHYSEKGARFAEPRRFPYTTPNAVAGECGVAFGLTGPGLAVASGFHGGAEALAVAATLVRAGDAEKMVVVAVDEIGDTARALAVAAGHYHWAFHSGAVALLLSSAPLGYAKIEKATLRSNVASPLPVEAPGHRALVPLCLVDVPREIGSSSPWGFGRVFFAQS